MCICDNWYVLYVLVDCQLARPIASQLKVQQVPFVAYIYILLPPDDGQVAIPKRVEV
jgi:hypothetical protein